MGENIFNIKPALLVKSITYHVFGDRIECQRLDDVDVTQFSDIKSARFAVTAAREYRFRRLDLQKSSGDVFKISITTTMTATRHNDSELAEYYALLEALSLKVSAARPGLKLIYSETQKMLWIMFSIGLIAVLAAVGMLALAIATNVSDKKLMNALVPMAILALFGAYTCALSNPFKKKPVLDFAAFAAILNAL